MICCASRPCYPSFPLPPLDVLAHGLGGHRYLLTHRGKKPLKKYCVHRTMKPIGFDPNTAPLHTNPSNSELSCRMLQGFVAWILGCKQPVCMICAMLVHLNNHSTMAQSEAALNNMGCLATYLSMFVYIWCHDRKQFGWPQYEQVCSHGQCSPTLVQQTTNPLPTGGP